MVLFIEELSVMMTVCELRFFTMYVMVTDFPQSSDILFSILEITFRDFICTHIKSDCTDAVMVLRVSSTYSMSYQNMNSSFWPDVVSSWFICLRASSQNTLKLFSLIFQRL